MRCELVYIYIACVCVNDFNIKIHANEIIMIFKKKIKSVNMNIKI